MMQKIRNSGVKRNKRVNVKYLYRTGYAVAAVALCMIIAAGAKNLIEPKTKSSTNMELLKNQETIEGIEFGGIQNDSSVTEQEETDEVENDDKTNINRSESVTESANGTGTSEDSKEGSGHTNNSGDNGLYTSNEISDSAKENNILYSLKEYMYKYLNKVYEFLHGR